MDDVLMALLQEGQIVVVPYLVRIFHACLSTGYVPAILHQVKVVFIPKSVRNLYSGPRDFRPNTLTLFLLTTIDILVDRFLRDVALALVPSYPHQHAYQTGKSVETALHQHIFHIEKVLEQQETALGVFLYIEMAFNVSYESMCDGLVKHRLDHTIIQWIRAMLEGQLLVVTKWIFHESCGIQGLSTGRCVVANSIVHYC